MEFEASSVELTRMRWTSDESRRSRARSAMMKAKVTKMKATNSFRGYRDKSATLDTSLHVIDVNF